MILRISFLLLFTYNLGFAQLPDSLRNQFTYAKFKVPITTKSLVADNGLEVSEIHFTSANEFVTSAYVTVPVSQKSQKLPLMIFQHWGEGDKNEFLDEAKAQSAKGWICILPDGPWKSPNSKITSFTRQGFEMYWQTVVNAMVAIDLMEQRYRIDKANIFFTGHSFGCNTGAILSAVDDRIDGFIFMAGAYSNTRYIAESKFPDFVEWRTSQPEQFKHWQQTVRPLDAELYLKYKTKPCLIQVATIDEYISTAQNEEFINGTPEPKTVRRYDSGHALNDKAMQDRMIWLESQQIPSNKKSP